MSSLKSLIKQHTERLLSLKLIAEFASESAYNLLRFIQKEIDEYGSYDGEVRRIFKCWIYNYTTNGYQFTILDLSRSATTLNRLERSIQIGINKIPIVEIVLPI
ncbi:hypothetical protein Tco_0898906 [Tanacetum coccineum]